MGIYTLENMDLSDDQLRKLENGDYIDIEFTLNDIDEYDKSSLGYELYEENYMGELIFKEDVEDPSTTLNNTIISNSLDSEDFANGLKTLAQNYHRLSDEEIQIIQQIAKKY